MSAEFEKISKKWKRRFKNQVSKYNNTFNESVERIYVKFFYIDMYNELKEGSKKRIELCSGRLYRNDLVNLVLENSKRKDKDYDVFSILKYNFNLKYDDILTFVHRDIDDTFMNKIKDIEDMGKNEFIKWEDSLKEFRKFNELLIFYKEIPKKREKVSEVKEVEEEEAKEEVKEVKEESKRVIEIFRKLKRKRPRRHTRRLISNNDENNSKKGKKGKKREKRKRRKRRKTRKKIFYES